LGSVQIKVVSGQNESAHSPLITSLGLPHKNPTHERGIVGAEVLEHRQIDAAQAEQSRVAAGAGSDDKVGIPIAIEVLDSDSNASKERRIRREVIDHMVHVHAVDHDHVAFEIGTGPHADDDVGKAVGIDVARRHVNAAGERGRYLEFRRWRPPD